MSEVKGKLTRWSFRIVQMDFEVIHQARIKHQTSDALPRLKITEENDRPLDDNLRVLIIHTATASDCEDKVLSREQELYQLIGQRIT